MKIQPSKLAEISESWFRRNREEMAACLAAGEDLLVHGSPYLTYENLKHHLDPKYIDQMSKAIELCGKQPERGGKHVQRILENAALDLINAHESAFRASYEEEINQKDAA